MKYKITIEKITEEEVPETEYKRNERFGREEDRDEYKYGYIETGKMEIKRNEQEIYVQEIDDLDIGELAIYINRAK